MANAMVDTLYCDNCKALYMDYGVEDADLYNFSSCPQCDQQGVPLGRGPRANIPWICRDHEIPKSRDVRSVLRRMIARFKNDIVHLVCSAVLSLRRSVRLWRFRWRNRAR